MTTKEATCTRCGCTDSNPCPGGCGWIWVDHQTGEGVCTSCTALLPAAVGIPAASPLDDYDLPELDEEEWDDEIVTTDGAKMTMGEWALTIKED